MFLRIDGTNNGKAVHVLKFLPEKSDKVNSQILSGTTTQRISDQLLIPTNVSEAGEEQKQSQTETVEQHTQHNLVQWSHNSSRRQDWRHLPAEMIHMIASALDGRSLARLERTDKFTHSVVAKRSIVLWRTLADRAESKTKWISQQMGDTMTALRQTNPKQYFIEHYGFSRALLDRFLEVQHEKLQLIQYPKRSLALRWYDEIIQPICLLLLLILFVIFLTYQLQTNDGVVTWMTMSPMLIFCGLIIPSSCLFCTIRYRSHVIYFRNCQPPRYTPQYDTYHFIPNNYATESRSFINGFITVLGEKFTSSSHYWPSVSRSQLLLRYVLASAIMLGVLICIIFISLRVTGTVDWNWAFVFTPFFLAMCLITLIACFPSSPRGSMVMAAQLLFGLSPLIIFITLLTMYLNNGGSTSSLRLQYVFIPLYLIDAITFLIAFLAAFFIGSSPNGRDHCSRTRILHTVLAFIAWIVFIGPFFYLKIALGLRADGGSGASNLAIFLPLLLPVLAILSAFIYFLVSDIYRTLTLRSDDLATESRQAAEEGRKIPSTVEEMENDPSFVLTISDRITLETLEQFENDLTL